ncbi:MAG: hypothetical protein KZQ73_15215 [Candidatus Thiodiazotropha sp. (ex Semelilucina semeliformis)]|nr:hypothetical protein [Candidatus Thiodiazotropha sp. (ex Myrtea spinifera)]MCU7809199.1 hypothetical protein [Candidatus Thiodiazotropha sp. (ex Semelilucina semeliformis)]
MNNFRPMALLLTILLSFSAVVADEVGTGSGTVAEVIDVGSYTYVQLREQGVWIATSRLSASVGDKIEYRGGMEMRGFYSKKLDRKFDSIIFVQMANRVGEDIGNTQHGKKNSEGGGAENTITQRSSSVQAPVPGEIPPLPDGMTIANIMAQATQLNEQSVSVRARVIKVSPNIMGKNWITLRDGTGTAPDDKLIATSKEMVSPGELVIVKGVIKNDIDIGSGYQYKVLLEQAEFSESEVAP